MAIITLEQEYELCQRPGVRERFAQFVKPIEKTGCHEWTGGRHPRSKYGRFAIIYLGSQETLSRFTHRVAWQLYRGPIPPRLKVLHRCDNPPCVNPDHLFLGTNADNSQDMVLKGRGPAQQIKADIATRIIEALKLYRQGAISISQIARDFGVQRRSVQRINSGHAWQLLPRPW